MKHLLTLLSVPRLLAAAFVLSLSGQVYASPIEISNSAYNPLEINESFRNFYSFADGTPWSANTGYEQANTLTAFFTKYLDEKALFLIFSGPGGNAGAVNFDIVGSEGRISFVDDPVRRLPNGTTVPRDPVVGNNVSMAYIEGYTDGLVYSGLFSDDWSVDINFNSSSNLNAFRFLSFDEQGNQSILRSFDRLPSSLSFVSTAQVVSAPAISLVVLFGTLLFTRRINRKQN